MSQPPLQLEYARPQPPWYRRQYFRRAIFVIVVGGASIALIFAGRATWTAIQRHRMWQDILARQEACMNYSSPPDRVVFEDDPIEGKKLLASDPHYRQRGGGEWPAYVDYTSSELAQLYELPFPSTTGIVFLHRAQSPRGNTRLIFCFVRGVDANGRMLLLALAEEPAAVERWPSYPSESHLEIHWPLPRHLRLMAAQPDPANASHFTIGYELDGQKGTIDGWLQNDDSIKLQVRDGPAKALPASVR